MAQPEIPGTAIGRPVMPYGSDGSKWIALLVDVLGRLQVDATIDNLPSDLATQTTLAALLVELGLKADLTEIQPVEAKGGDKIFSVEDRWYENLEGEVTGGTFSNTSTPVPAGEIYVLQAVSIRNNGRAGVNIDFMFDNAAIFGIYIYYKASTLQYEPAFLTGNFVLKEGDFVYVKIDGCQAGDDVDAAVWGYKMSAA